MHFVSSLFYNGEDPDEKRISKIKKMINKTRTFFQVIIYRFLINLEFLEIFRVSKVFVSTFQE